MRHLLGSADWSSPKCSGRAAKTLEQIIHLVDSFPVEKREKIVTMSPTKPGTGRRGTRGTETERER